MSFVHKGLIYLGRCAADDPSDQQRRASGHDGDKGGISLAPILGHSKSHGTMVSLCGYSPLQVDQEGDLPHIQYVSLLSPSFTIHRPFRVTRKYYDKHNSYLRTYYDLLPPKTPDS